MKVIVSHDIDHLSASEHYLRDLIVPKHLARTKLEFLSGRISFSEVCQRYLELFRNRFNNLEALQQFNLDMGVPGSFFLGVKNGLGLSYSLEQAAFASTQLLQNDCNVYLHGIHYNRLENILEEKDLFERTLNIPAKGIRMHYVRKDEHTLQRFADAGFLFDSTVSEFRDPYKIGRMWEFPIQIMDGWIIEAGKRRQTRGLEEAKEATKRVIDQAVSLKMEYLGVDFHDRYFSKSFVTWMKWYTWLIGYVKQQGFSIRDFETAVMELEIARPAEAAVFV